MCFKVKIVFITIQSFTEHDSYANITNILTNEEVFKKNTVETFRSLRNYCQSIETNVLTAITDGAEKSQGILVR